MLKNQRMKTPVDTSLIFFLLLKIIKLFYCAQICEKIVLSLINLTMINKPLRKHLFIPKTKVIDKDEMIISLLKSILT